MHCYFSARSLPSSAWLVEVLGTSTTLGVSGIIEEYGQGDTKISTQVIFQSWPNISQNVIF